MPAIERQDKQGFHWTVPADGKSSPRLEVWWSRVKTQAPVSNIKTLTENLVLTQDNGKLGMSVFILTPGQVYDLIDALNRAVEKW